MEKTNEEIILRTIARKMSGGRIDGKKIYFEKYALTAAVHSVKLVRNPKGFSAQTVFAVTHPEFDEPIIEACGGLGKKERDALESAGEGFASGVLSSIASALSIGAAFGDAGGRVITSSAAGREITYRLPEVMPVLTLGAAPSYNTTDMWKHIADEVPVYLGRKTTYWIKLYAVWTGKAFACEAVVNNSPCSGLSELLKEKLEPLFDKSGYNSRKEFILIRRTEPEASIVFDPVSVKEYTLKAVEISAQAKDSEEAFVKMKELCGDVVLAYELAYFIPEIYSKAIRKKTAEEDIILDMGAAPLTVKKTVLRDFGYIESGVNEYIYRNAPSESFNEAIIGKCCGSSPAVFRCPEGFEIR